MHGILLFLIQVYRILLIFYNIQLLFVDLLSTPNGF